MTDAAADPRNRPGHFIGGDPLRGISAMGIATLHCAIFAPAYLSGEFAGVTYGNVGNHGVAFTGNLLNIFFVLSGFLIGRPFVRWIIDGAKRPDLKQYGRNRVLRVVPAFWAACLVAIVVHGVDGNSFADVVALFGFAQVFAHGEAGSPTIYVDQGWTISIEAMFYVAVPIAGIAFGALLRGRGTRAARAAFVLTGTAVLCAASLWARGHWAATIHGQRLPQSMLYAFTPGLALAAFEPFAGRLRGVAWAGWAALAAVAGGFALMATLAADHGVSPQRSAVYLALASGLVVGGALVKEWATGASWRALDNRVLHWIGERSLGLYVFHFLVQRAVFDALQNHHPGGRWELFLFSFAITTPLSLLAAAVSWRVIETPALNMRRTTLQAPVAPAAAL